MPHHSRRIFQPPPRGPALMLLGLAVLTAPAGVRAQDAPLRPSLADAADSTGLPPLPASGAANYGKPRVFVPAGKKPKKAFAVPLPPLVPYPASAEARRAAKSGAPSQAPSPTTAMPASIPQKPRPRVDPDPYAPVGFDLGLLRVKAYAETDLGYADNPNQAPKGAPDLRGSAYVREEVGAAAASDWSNHSFVGDLRLGYDDFFAASSADAPDGTGKFTARVDVARDTRIVIDGNFDLSTQLQSSPNLNNNGAPTTLASRPIVADYGGGLGVTHDFNRLELSLRGGVERTWWGDARFTDGSTQYLSRDSYDDYGLTLRASYEATPGVKPFVQGFVDRRDHDSLVDTSGYMRNSVGDAFTSGATFELTRLLTGQIAAGYADRRYEDPRLANLRGPIVESSLVWTATPLTTLTLRGATTLDETTVAGASGTITRVGGIAIAHALLRNLTLTATASVTLSDYVGGNINQELLQAGLKAEYALSRHVAIKATFAHQRLLSTTPGVDYTANIMMVGLKLQE